MIPIFKNIKTNFKILIITFLIVVPQCMFSQKSWTLDDCVAYAIQHNLQLNDFELNVDSSKETYRQSFRNILPVIRGRSEYGTRFGRSVDPNDNTISDTDFFNNEYILEGSFSLFQGFQKQNMIKASKFLYKAANEETLQQKYLLAFRVMQAFYDIQFFKGALVIAKEQEHISLNNYDLVKKQIELGRLAEGDLYEAESVLLRDKLEVIKTGNQLTAAKLALTREMNFSTTNDINTVIELNEEVQNSQSPEINSDSVFDAAKDFIPIIKSREFRSMASRKQLAIERGKLAPTIDLVGQYGTSYFETVRDNNGITIPFKDQLKTNSFHYIGLTLRIPILNGWSGRSRIKQQKVAVLRAKNDLEIQHQELYQTIQELIQQYYAFRTEYEQTIKNIEVQKLAFNIAQKRYEKGIINTIELFTAKNLLATAQNENLRVGLGVEVNKSTLDFYRGLSVFNIKNHNTTTTKGSD